MKGLTRRAASSSRCPASGLIDCVARAIATLMMCSGIALSQTPPHPDFPPVGGAVGSPSGVAIGAGDLLQVNQTPHALKPVGPHDALQSSSYNFEVTSSGEAVWSMPIWAPAGRNGISPSLAFTYRSRRGPGLMGQGFDVSGLSAVTRCWRTAAQDGHFMAGPVHGVPDVYCLDGERLVPHGALTTELQPEFDPSVLVRVNGPDGAPTSFDVYRSDGQIWRYGSREACPASSQSQVKGHPLVASAAKDANGVFTTDDFTEEASATELVLVWNVDRVEDRWGNFFDVVYTRGFTDPWSVEVLPGAILWTRWAPYFERTACSEQSQLGWSRRIVFEYTQLNSDGTVTPSARMNPRSALRGGLAIRQDQLLSRIVVEGPEGIVLSVAPRVRSLREYRMAYKPVPAGKQVLDRLESITECIYNTARDTVCREPVSFSWTDDNPAVPEFLPAKDPVQAVKDDPSVGQDMSFDTTTGVADILGFATLFLGGSPTDSPTLDELDSVVADFDGDGRDDLLYRTLASTEDYGSKLYSLITQSHLGGLDLGIPLSAPEGQWFLRLGTADGLGPRHPVQGLPVKGGGDPRFSPQLVDIDQDGQPEVLLYSQEYSVTVNGNDIQRSVDPSYDVADTFSYDVFKLAAHTCSDVCQFIPMNMGESRTRHTTELSHKNLLDSVTLVPLVRNIPSVMAGDLDGDGQVDLTEVDMTAANDACLDRIDGGIGSLCSMGFRRGARAVGFPGDAPIFSSPKPLKGPLSDIFFNQYDGRYLVDVEGSGKLELLAPIHHFSFESPRGASLLSAISLNASADGLSQTSTVALSAWPLSTSPMMARLRNGPCQAVPTQLYNIAGNTSLPVEANFTRMFLDLDGDGLRDAISFADSGRDPCDATVPSVFVSSNVGGNFRASTPLSLTAIDSGPKLGDLFVPAAGLYDTGARVADLNRDGREGLVFFSQAGVFWLKWTGQGLETHQLPIAGTNGAQMVAGTPTQYPSGVWTVNYGPRLSRIGDFNGDGILDLVNVRESKLAGAPPHSYLEVNLGAPRGPDMVSGIDGGRLRPRIDIHYRFASKVSGADLYQPAISVSWPQADVRLGWVVSDYSTEAGDIDGAKPLVDVTRLQYQGAKSDLTGRGFLGVERFTRTLTDDAPTPAVFQTDILDFDHGVFSRVCQAESTCTYPSVDSPTSGVSIAPIDAAKHRVTAWHVSRTVQPRPSGSGYDLVSDSVTTDVCDITGQLGIAVEGIPCAGANLISSVRETRSQDAYGAVTQTLRETSDNDSLMLSSTTPRWRDVVNALPPLSPVYTCTGGLTVCLWPEGGRWLNSRYSHWQFTSTDLTLPLAEQTVQNNVDVTYELASTEIKGLTISPPAGASPETDATSGYSSSTIYHRTGQGTVDQIVETASGNSRTIHIGFAPNDPDLIFPSSFTNPLGQTTTILPHATFGVAMAADDANGVRTLWDYDMLGRPTAIYPPGGGREFTTYTDNLRPDGSPARTWTLSRLGAAIPDVAVTFDALGFPIARSTEEFSATALRTFDYDRFGRLSHTGYPVDASLSKQSTLFIGYERDGIGRVTARWRPKEKRPTSPLSKNGDYVSRFLYEGRETSTISERGVRSNLYHDGKGRVVRNEVQVGTRTVGIDVDYWHYDLTRHIRYPILPPDQVMTPAPAVTQPQVTLTYDAFGRSTAQDDPDAGHRGFFYNGYGELKRVEDANGGVTTVERDDLGRVRHLQTAANAAYPARLPSTAFAQVSHFTYDTQPHGIGKLAQATSIDGIAKTYSYDTWGRLQEVDTTDETGRGWPMSYERNVNGLISAINYPPSGSQPFRLEYEYAADGELASIFNASTPARAQLWRQIDKNVKGDSLHEALGSTEAVSLNYERNFALKSQTANFTSNSESFQNITYSWGPDGLLTAKTDVAIGLAESYDHDEFGRLFTWQATQGGGHTSWRYDYDDWGNLRQRRVMDGTAFDPTVYDYTTPADATRPHAVKRITTGTAAPLDYTYLGGGEVSSGGGNSYGWTPFGLPASVSDTALTSQLLYDGFGQRTVRLDRPGSRQVTLSSFTYRSTGAADEYAYNVANGRGVVAQIKRTVTPPSENLQLYHPDQLGNPDVTTTIVGGGAQAQVVGQVIGRSKFEPFGERRSASAVAQPVAQAYTSPMDPGFAGGQPDEPFGLLNMGGRLYQPGAARFMSPDPVLSLSLSGLNRYSYGRNSPIMYVDPTGYQAQPWDSGDDEWHGGEYAWAKGTSWSPVDDWLPDNGITPRKYDTITHGRESAAKAPEEGVPDGNGVWEVDPATSVRGGFEVTPTWGLDLSQHDIILPEIDLSNPLVSIISGDKLPPFKIGATANIPTVPGIGLSVGDHKAGLIISQLRFGVELPESHMYRLNLEYEFNIKKVRARVRLSFTGDPGTPEDGLSITVSTVNSERLSEGPAPINLQMVKTWIGVDLNVVPGGAIGRFYELFGIKEPEWLQDLSRFIGNDVYKYQQDVKSYPKDPQ